jgi:hypothetical protein
LEDVAAAVFSFDGNQSGTVNVAVTGAQSAVTLKFPRRPANIL